jgi:hypothetical protein
MRDFFGNLWRNHLSYTWNGIKELWWLIAILIIFYLITPWLGARDNPSPHHPQQETQRQVFN